jgi:cyclic pyranopterin phosphate synthase
MGQHGQRPANQTGPTAPTELPDMLAVFHELVRAGRVEERPHESIRVKLTTRCQWSCHFCHMEGNPRSQLISGPDELLPALDALRDRLGFREVHLTGGEPTLHPGVVELVDALTRRGYVTKLTTNGTSRLAAYLACAEAGLSEINVSMHTADPAALAATMAPRRSATWAEQALTAQRELCDRLAGLVKVKINTCVGADETEACRIADFAERRGLPWRAMNILETPVESFAALRRLCDRLEAVPVSANVIRGSSSCGVTLRRPSGFTFRVKLIRPYRPAALCAGCPTAAAGQCYEHAYGPRLEKDGALKIRSCVHRQDGAAVLPLRDYLRHEVCEDLRRAVM